MQGSASAEQRAIRQFTTSEGARIFQVPLQAFPGLWGYVYLVLTHDPASGEAMRVLIDAGSGFGDSNQQLDQSFQTISELAGEPLSLANLTHVLITHGHIDHFGGLQYVRPRTPAKIGVHELDRRILTNYEEVLAVTARRLENYLVEAGLSPEHRKRMIEMYLITKSLHHSVRVDFTYEAAGMVVGPFELLHVPGHCAGHVVLRLHDVLFAGDHVLEHTSPHQSPEQLTLSTGLEHYFLSLAALKHWVQARPVRMTLGGHDRPILDLEQRIDEIEQVHQRRLEKVLEILAVPHTIAEVSRQLFGERHAYDILLALEEAGAHVEYLYQRGRLGIANLAELEDSQQPAPIRYFRLEGEEAAGSGEPAVSSKSSL